MFGARLALGRGSFPRLGLDGPTLAFSVWTLLAAAFSTDPLASHEDSKKLVLFLLLYLAVDGLAAHEQRERVVDAMLLGGAVLAAGMLSQYYLLGFDTLNHRPRSLQGHYMTASGLVMCALVLGASRLAFLRRWPGAPEPGDLRRLGLVLAGLLGLCALQHFEVLALEGERLFVAGLALCAGYLGLRPDSRRAQSSSVLVAALAVGLSSWALLVSRTRSAWLGAVAGLVVVAVLRAPRTLFLLAGALAAVLVVRPAVVMERLTVRDASSVDRYYMWQAGLDMIQEKPIFGQGPGMIVALYPRYRWPGAPNPQAPHLHDNALQIAAERGLPCLVWWLWWVAVALVDSLREFRRSSHPGAGPAQSPWPAAAALAVLSAVLVAGLFEYNIGDSEVLMFALLTLALPYSTRHARMRNTA